MQGRTGKQVKSDYHYQLKGLWVYYGFINGSQWLP